MDNLVLYHLGSHGASFADTLPLSEMKLLVGEIKFEGSANGADQ